MTFCQNHLIFKKCETDQVIKFRILAEEGFTLFFLAAHEVLNVHIKAGRGDAFRAECGLLTFLKKQSQQGEQGVSVDTGTMTKHSLIVA